MVDNKPNWEYVLKNGCSIKMDRWLVYQLDSIIHNAKNDWDFVILITGDGMVRTGKSVLGLNVCAYLADKLDTPFDINNIYYDSDTMINGAYNNPPNSIMMLDEASRSMSTSKRFKDTYMNLNDFFTECGQLNHIFVLISPDFFSLNWELATNRSEFLLNVYRKEVKKEKYLYGDKSIKKPITDLKRGQFEFYNRAKKGDLYWKGKRTGARRYNLVKPNFFGVYGNCYPFEEEIYRAKKLEALMAFKREKETDKVKKLTVTEKEFITYWQSVDPEERKIYSKWVGTTTHGIDMRLKKMIQRL